jgi:hypothetical protein
MTHWVTSTTVVVDVVFDVVVGMAVDLVLARKDDLIGRSFL